ncbi:NHL repeat-containing protein [Hymenobacter edaphi]|uniref:SMP-30/Gluconolactonase/LRE-like region domain-containing protein n=1 Tax=Hymenobacter edaphi TaxID=2211146 RepID=A0A328BVG4_9BACT|nr:NHL repeat-containing protein [Hymenobacter edaphi]RAK70036.1 hypothetical protein DLM85_04070 [Hymenobacter edaphi]
MTNSFPSWSTVRLGALLLGVAACGKKESDPQKPRVYTTVSTLAGSGVEGFADGAGSAARFAAPEGAAVDGQGNVYVADPGNARIRKITPAGMVSTLAGTGTAGTLNGALTTARFVGPVDVAIDSQNNLYVADGNCIRRIAGNTVSTYAGAEASGYAEGSATAARFSSVNGVTVDARGVLYVSDYSNYRIRKIMPDGTVSTLAGTGQRGYADGAGSTAQFAGPEGLAVDAQGTVYVADFAGYRIRKITPEGTVSTLAGTGQRGSNDGAGSTAQFAGPTGITLDAQGNLYVADIGNHCIRKVTPAGDVSTLAGTRVSGATDGPVGTAQFDLPAGMTSAGDGTLYVTEFGQRIRAIKAE